MRELNSKAEKERWLECLFMKAWWNFIRSVVCALQPFLQPCSSYGLNSSYRRSFNEIIQRSNLAQLRKQGQQHSSSEGWKNADECCWKTNESWQRPCLLSPEFNQFSSDELGMCKEKNEESRWFHSQFCFVQRIVCNLQTQVECLNFFNQSSDFFVFSSFV